MSDIKFKSLIFDLDGVLIDSKRNMEASWQECQRSFDLENSFQDYFSLIGRPFNEILSLLNINYDFDKIKHVYDKTSISNIGLISFYPNVVRCLKEFHKKKINLFIVTSKDSKRAQITLRKVKNLFLYISCPEKKLRGKPYPDQILNIINKFSLEPKECVYIGDTKVDQLAAKAAEIDFLFANWGYGPKPTEEYKEINQITDLMNFI